MAQDQVSDLKKEIVKTTQRAETAEARVTQLEAMVQTGHLLEDIVTLADEGYNAVNARALAHASDASISGFEQAPAGQEPEVRPHLAFKVALEQVLDGLDKAVHGFDYGRGGDRNGRQRHFNGMVDQVDFYKGRLERLQVAGDMVIVVEGQKPRLTEAGQFAYDRIVELNTMVAKFKEIAGRLEEAHHLVSPDEPYLPFAERMEKIAAEKETRKKEAGAIPDLFAKMGLDVGAVK